MSFEALVPVFAFLACGVMIGTYLYLRRPLITALDGFFFFFMLQYGPHTLFVTDSHRLAREISIDSQSEFQLGMAIAYLLVSLGLLLGSFFDFSKFAYRPFPNIFGKGTPLLIATVIYVIPFAIIQGPGLETTREYISAFLGQSQYSYVEIRRVIFAETPYEQLASLTRQTSTAILFAYLIAYIIHEPAMRILLVPAISVLFVLCGMQMNKFPFVYFFALAFVIGFTYWQRQLSGPLSHVKKGIVFLLFGSFALAIIGMLYSFQYEENAMSVTAIVEVIFYRIGLVSSDTLRLWFDYFPKVEDFTGFRNIGPLAAAMGENPINPTIAIPEHYVPNVITTFQSGFIGSGYASFGQVGIGVSSIIVGIFVAAIAKLQWAFRNDYAAHPFLCVLTLNMFFFTTRELHTAALSGGTVSVLLLFMGIQILGAAIRRR